jgi:probable FeS assembly SUF system protein SufT
MGTHEPITLSRDCEAITIPSGERVTLPAGSEVRVIQTLGGSFTVATEWGHMLRIAGQDADAIGEEIAPELAAGGSGTAEGPVDVEKLVWNQLRTCFDPEIPVNIVDLGLVYFCRITPLPEGGNRAEVKFTLTAPGCGMGDVLKADVQAKALSVPGIEDIDVEVVVEPPWDPSRMSEAAKLQLGMM